MATATVTANLEHGRYRIIIGQDTTKLIEGVAKADEAISSLTAKIATGETETAAALSTYQTAMDTLNSLINTYKADQTQENRDAVQDAVIDSIEAEQAWLTLRTTLRENKLHLLAAQKQKEALETILAGITTTEREAWTVDLKTDIEVGATVGITEINGETGRINISAQGTETDGKVTPVKAATPHQAFVAKTLQPGWQKWRPTYRYGTITAIDYELNTCSITLDTAESTTQTPRSKADDGTITEPAGYEINQTETLENVPIQYMTCNSRAFIVDDHVVIQFQNQDWAAPVVIGFVDNPVGCGITIQLRFLSALGSSAFINWCDYRINETTRYINYIDYFANTFIPQVVSKIGQMDHVCKLVFGGVPIFYSAEEIEAMQKPWNDFVTLEYPNWRSEIVSIRTQWTQVKAAAAYFSTHFRGYISGCLDENDNQSNVSLLDYIMTVSCCPTEQTAPATDDMTDYQAAYTLSDFAELLDLEASEACSPFTNITLTIPSLVRLFGIVRGAFNQAQNKIYLYTGYLDGYIYGIPDGWIEGLQWVFKINTEQSQAVLTYPGQTEYSVVETDMPAVGEENDVTVTFGLSGRIMTVPTSFGATVPAWNVDPATGIYYGDLVEFSDGYTFAQLCMLFQGGMFYDPISRNPWGVGGGYGIQEQ